MGLIAGHALAAGGGRKGQSENQGDWQIPLGVDLRFSKNRAGGKKPNLRGDWTGRITYSSLCSGLKSMIGSFPASWTDRGANTSEKDRPSSMYREKAV